MKHILLALVILLSALSAQAKEVVAAISPYYSHDTRQTILKDMATLYSGLALGDRLTFINGDDASIISSVSVPEDDVYKHRVTKLRHGAKALAKLNAFIKSMKQDQRTLGAMDVPLVLNQIVRNYPSANEILLIGSALYDNPQQPGVNMTSMHIPSDGFITAKPTDSPFGTLGREKHLQGKRIHWLLPKSSSDSLHSEALLRLMHLYIQQMGGALVSFTANSDAVMQLLLENAKPMNMEYQLDRNGKLYMQAIRKLVPELSLYQQPITQTPMPQQVLNSKQTLIVGIEWQGKGVDLDIYAKAQGLEALSYRNTANALGKHYKDVLSGHSHADNKQYETIEFAPINVNSLVIVVNVYRSQNAQPILGTLRLQLAGNIYAKSFRFTAARGNKGKDVSSVLSGIGDTAHSKRFSVKDIVNAAGVVL